MKGSKNGEKGMCSSFGCKQLGSAKESQWSRDEAYSRIRRHCEGSGVGKFEADSRTAVDQL
jgi:hypothetical protein